MGALKVLFIGGTGVISSASAAAAVEMGIDLTFLNRGTTSIRPVPSGVTRLNADIRDPGSVRAALGDRTFDVVVQFIAFTPEHIETDLALFGGGRCGQYVFISSASAYAKPVLRVPITESTPLRNPYWQYARDKIACEESLRTAYRERGFPITIVRPSSTYDRTKIPLLGGWTGLHRLRTGRPVIVHGDGTSLWVQTHTRDFAKAFTGLLGHPQAIGEAFQITSDEVSTWDQIHRTMAAAAGLSHVDDARLVHITSDAIAAVLPKLGPTLLGDKTHSVVFDNSKVKALVPGYVATIPFATGAREIVEWYDAHPEHQVVDPELDRAFDDLVTAHDRL